MKASSRSWFPIQMNITDDSLLNLSKGQKVSEGSGMGGAYDPPHYISSATIIAARGQFTAWLSNSSINTLPSEKHKSHDNRHHASSRCNNLSFS